MATFVPSLYEHSLRKYTAYPTIIKFEDNKYAYIPHI
jgi:hypothetical protein